VRKMQMEVQMQGGRGTGDGTGRDFLHVTSNIIGPVQEA